MFALQRDGDFMITVHPYNCTLVWFAECHNGRVVGDLYATRREAEAGATYPVKAIRFVRDRRTVRSRKRDTPDDGREEVV